MNEKEKMLKGLWYDANNDSELIDQRNKTMDLCFKLNHTSPLDKEERALILKKLIYKLGDNHNILSPFYCDYGFNIEIGDNVFINLNNYLMDCGKIIIGDNVFIGPSCGLYTAIHPLNKEERNKGLEMAEPITVGNNVWIGANVVIFPGVTIGDNCVIGAGSLVNKSIEANSLAFGNPCRVVKKI